MTAWAAASAAPPAPTCGILVYHRFGPGAGSSMATTTAVFAGQMDALHAAGYDIVPLSDLVDTLRQRRPPAPGPRAAA